MNVNLSFFDVKTGLRQDVKFTQNSDHKKCPYKLFTSRVTSARNY